jgi:hypothetical protein
MISSSGDALASVKPALPQELSFSSGYFSLARALHLKALSRFGLGKTHHQELFKELMAYSSSPPGMVAAPARAYRAIYKRSLLDGIVMI